MCEDISEEASKIDIHDLDVLRKLWFMVRDSANNKEIFVFVIPGNETLNLKKAALASETKSIEMIKEKELLPLTGYIKGGCSPIGLKRQFPIFIDETAQLFDEIYMSAGVRGAQVKLNANELKELVSIKFADLV